MAGIECIPADSADLIWEISDFRGKHHVSCVHRNLGVGGSGLAEREDIAKKIAFCELNERYLVRQIASDKDLAKAWELDFDDSCSGFAIGYRHSSAMLRAVYEACERWTLSQWVDEGKKMEKLRSPALSPFANGVSEFFERCDLYLKEVPVILNAQVLKINVIVLLGWSRDGVFAGYGTNADIAAAIDHSFVEAARNYLIDKHQEPRAKFPYDRISFFARNRKAAENVITAADDPSWPTNPGMGFMKAEAFGEFYLARAIFSGWEPWQRGDESRFLY